MSICTLELDLETDINPYYVCFHFRSYDGVGVIVHVSPMLGERGREYQEESY